MIVEIGFTVALVGMDIPKFCLHRLDVCRVFQCITIAMRATAKMHGAAAAAAKFRKTTAPSETYRKLGLLQEIASTYSRGIKICDRNVIEGGREVRSR